MGEALSFLAGQLSVRELGGRPVDLSLEPRGEWELRTSNRSETGRLCRTLRSHNTWGVGRVQGAFAGDFEKE